MTASIKLFAIRHLWKQKRPFPLAEKTREKKKKIEKGERGKEKRIQSDTECIRHVDTNSPTGRSNSHRCIFTELSRVTDCVAGFCTWTGCNDTSEYDRRRDGKNCGRSSRNCVTPRLFTRRTRTRVRSNVAAAAPVKCHGSRCSIISLPASHLHQQIFDDFCSCLSAWLTVSCYSVKCGLFFSFFFFFFPFFFFFFLGCGFFFFFFWRVDFFSFFHCGCVYAVCRLWAGRTAKYWAFLLLAKTRAAWMSNLLNTPGICEQFDDGILLDYFVLAGIGELLCEMGHTPFRLVARTLSFFNKCI